MKGYTIGTGTWRKVAQAAAARMQAMTGIPCEVFVPSKKWAHPSWGKCEIPVDGPTLIFDADIWCMEKWEPRHAPGAVCMVPEPSNRFVDIECRLYGIERHRYCNGGLMILDDPAILPAVAAYAPRYGRWLEQTAINKVLVGRDVTLLSPRLNHLLRANKEPMDADSLRAHGAINLHFTGPDKTPDWLLKKYEELT